MLAHISLDEAVEDAHWYFKENDWKWSVGLGKRKPKRPSMAQIRAMYLDLKKSCREAKYASTGRLAVTRLTWFGIPFYVYAHET